MGDLQQKSLTAAQGSDNCAADKDKTTSRQDSLSVIQKLIHIHAHACTLEITASNQVMFPIYSRKLNFHLPHFIKIGNKVETECNSSY